MKFAKKNPVLSRSAASEKLPLVVNLTIVKLDGDEYNIQVGRNATLRKVKKAVQNVFADKGVSWPLVWNYFCLVYKDYEIIDDESVCKEYKLIDNKDKIRNIPIKDRGKLYFVHHRQPGATCSFRRPFVWSSIFVLPQVSTDGRYED
ncbi:uncharacterized protein LOC113324711 [Papaver somniferum]|uniref:uncharacterized protein LOC113324711 n=1 Tax=Papaver somniferum TaxID=3469 RepID=UPI000E6FE841|nr:uncharacterized protein LOC113324711 [Papaver somniferum]